MSAVNNAPPPENLTQLRSFLGMLNHYTKFLKDVATVIEPLNRLLRKETKWSCGKEEQEAFSKAKKMLCSETVLVHYDNRKKIVLSCDASNVGISAVLAHKNPDGTESPIAYASRTLSSAERNYSMVEKEGLVCVFGVTRFYQYLLGVHFTLVSDHKPLMRLFNESKGVPQMSSGRTQRWALTLAAYDYEIKFRAGKLNYGTDALSRLPQSTAADTTPVPGDVVLLMECINNKQSPVKSKEINVWTDRDPLLSYVRHSVSSGSSVIQRVQVNNSYRSSRFTETAEGNLA